MPGVRKPAGLLSGAPDTEKTPRHFPSAVSLPRPFASACPPCRSTLMQALTPAALPFACASARPLRSVGCRRRRRRRHPRRTAIAASDALAQPQEGHAQANAAGVRRSALATADGVAGFGSGLPSTPASQPLLSRRRRNVAPKVAPTGFKSALLCVAIPEAGLSPQSSPGGQGPLDPPTADRRHPVTPFPRAVFAPLTSFSD